MSAAPALLVVRASSARNLEPASRLAQTMSGPIETLAFYRRRTEALLRQYMQWSMEMGRTPSILGNCVFRGKVSSYKLHSFEDRIIFVFDIEKCLKRLDKYSQELVARIALQEYSQGEAAQLLGQSVRSVVRRYADAIDSLTAIFLDHELLNVEAKKSCQGVKTR